MKLISKWLKRFKKDSKIMFLFFGSLNLIIAQIILGILLLFAPIFVATFFSLIINISLNYKTYPKYVFKSNYRLSRQNLAAYYIYSIFIWIFYSSLIYFINIIFYINKNLIAILILPVLIPFTYLFQKKILSNR